MCKNSVFFLFYMILHRGCSQSQTSFLFLAFVAKRIPRACPTGSQIVPMSHDSNHAEPLEVQPS